MRRAHLFGSTLLAIAALSTAIAPVSVTAQPVMAATAYQGFSITDILGDASDSALDKLAQPDAFYNDKDVRIGLPGPLKKASGMLRFLGNAGIANDLTRSLNDAAGRAAEEAKPVFRAAIDELTLTDGIGIVTGGDRAGTDYLRRTSGEVLREKVRPLVASALGDVGAFDQLNKLQEVQQIASLAGADISNDGLTDSVTDQAMDGIFNYIGREEAKFRDNPLEKGKGLLDGIFGK
ncbi:DUF4197 domain-containing protein [Alterisphingorhabdus coralli]|uniref:DUF4197 domain-containing protein n=1 Tax=Alterisphingorhabdus coralli TaxID=3071408 RepID=A0AA97F5N6_9SPHN|nr:DUF4197 domain-containing protein [Parasphingorhabdus sp. SCSIO 66989]WOE74446.1 DUF4197 domain-containing protein [Parasphingorhabdus sp. SCSIO 66989]